MSLPLGAEVQPLSAERPEPVCLEGRYVRIEPLDHRAHGAALWEATGGAKHADLWTYLSDGPYADRASFELALKNKAASQDPLFFAILDLRSGLAAGYASYLRIEPQHRSMEVGSILYGPALQRTAGATEAMFLMARHAFEDLRFRRYEWKCNALHSRSRQAALRLGFRFEGIFRQHMIVKGRNRDTAWYSMLDSEWPSSKTALECWLDPANFDAVGRQKKKLSCARQ
ncbi:MAG TPA: GNAT family protein [Bryobacteraceae bacterium]|jgi:RimJ/RimL family protein N-acetyltransferase